MDNDIVQVENRFYIATNSSYADNRILILNNSDTFGIFDRWGDIIPFGPEVQGVYHQGTRFLSECEFRVNGIRPTLLSSAIKEENEVLSVDLTTEAFPERDGRAAIAKGTLHISRNKFVRNGSLHELIEFHNFGDAKCRFSASLSFRADFRDIFEIRGMKRAKRGEVTEKKHPADGKFRIKYLGLDNIERSTEVTLVPANETWEELDKALFTISLEPHGHFVVEYSIVFGISGKKPGENGKETRSVHTIRFSEAISLTEEHLARSKRSFANIITSNTQFNHWLNRSRTDLISLLAVNDGLRYPYAGVPWFNTAFGRDGIITAYQTLWMAPAIARDVLLFLAKNQAAAVNEYQASEPGKILHEVRGGEMVELNEIPFKRYYGSIDSTPLFVFLAGAYYERTADTATLQTIWPAVLKALDWMEKHGDMDGDGFLEYTVKGQHGLINQGWKDSMDSVFDEEGNIKAPPTTLCEVQAYVYAAKKQASKLAWFFGEGELSTRLNDEADKLKKKFHEAFWDNGLETFVLALDRDKKPCRVRASNAGHCLFAGIADKKPAELLVKRLLSEDMFSGWGIRTLSTLEKRFNPMAYHNGSVWPHDVALIAHGMARYGYRKEAMKLMSALFDASSYIEHQRLPELFCGFSRRKGEGPTSYPVACSPQAWSVGAVFMLMEASLYMQMDASEKKLVFKKPQLPDYLDNILISNLRLGEESATIEIYRYKDGVSLDVRENNSDWEIVVVK